MEHILTSHAGSEVAPAAAVTRRDPRINVGFKHVARHTHRRTCSSGPLLYRGSVITTRCWPITYDGQLLSPSRDRDRELDCFAT